ncbi:hypothetical protein EDC26_103251 [Paralcaligenes ureilyticus]|uniref:Uncharacterized protein n=1 Tax=Paralcaligenes ureilyticus TaxID=627131 RepID=A0A4R3M939_9BURK|nr:hypothetical protein EDC26_103251 [Paralcaligenes ureilyticus]
MPPYTLPQILSVSVFQLDLSASKIPLSANQLNLFIF